jgi:hypothetical protein
MERRLYDHEMAVAAIEALGNGHEHVFSMRASIFASAFGCSRQEAHEVFAAIDVLDGLFLPLLGYDGKPRRAIRNRHVPNRKARS